MAQLRWGTYILLYTQQLCPLQDFHKHIHPQDSGSSSLLLLHSGCRVFKDQHSAVWDHHSHLHVQFQVPEIWDLWDLEFISSSQSEHPSHTMHSTAYRLELLFIEGFWNQGNHRARVDQVLNLHAIEGSRVLSSKKKTAKNNANQAQLPWKWKINRAPFKSSNCKGVHFKTSKKEAQK